ncbi:MAG TPA: 2-oxoacid:acceptor oxidoreductase subunit alpha [Thermoanaerobaculia bacterium]|nr:2-oxoacid:acceptor oxidoreductase subunit alpha [Thermoanaerobaculia bacterium]HQP86880.1 2-oxoacid:acceptor oxidoreductase subunit alpha [Thermoanaerobaculia bacterium]
MSTAPSPAASVPFAVTVNDFSLQVATANGSGSQTANNVLLRSLFRMGVPVSGKNLFPSNIQGLPTWFTIRASRHGYIGRKRELDVLVLMNPETAAADAIAAAPGTSVVYERKLAVEKLRDDLRLFPVPFGELASKLPLPPEQAKLRRLLVNMIYVGVLSDLMGIEPVEIEASLRKQLGGKAKAIELNLAALRAGLDYSAATFPEKLPHRVERMDATAGKLIIDGNSASALGCLFGGATVCTWYPITPSSSLCETFIELCDRHRTDPGTGHTAAAIVQAEDEIASIGMVLGAGWAGARAFTATSGPGISLMSELIGYGYYAEIPAVIFDVQRVGPSTGLPTRTMQGDVLLCHTNSHGDGRHPVLFPASPEECFTMAQEAFDLAERLQTPVFVLTDLDLGMNNWMADPFPFSDAPFDRGKVLDADGVERLRETWGRYRDLDGDGVPWRTLPGTDHPRAAFFTRGSGHDERAAYTEKPDDYVRNMERLARKLETGRALLPKPVTEERPGAKAGLLAFGTSHYGTAEGRDRLEREHGLPLDYLRLRALPIGDEARAFLERHEIVYVVEQNRDAQLAGLLRDALPSCASRLVSVLQYDGLPLDATTVVDGVLAHARPAGGAR